MRHSRLINLTLAAALSTAALSPATAAERKQGQTPAAGVEATVAVGAPLLERYNLLVDPGVRVGGNVDMDLGMQGVIRISAGTLMPIVQKTAKQMRACTTTDAYTNMMGQTGAACLTDRDGDGLFDTASAKSTGLTTRHLPAPVPYTSDDVPETFGANNHRITLVYLGAANGVLHLSYREFSNDMAKPAFTEDLSFPLGPTYPQSITWQDTRVTLLGLTGGGLRYRVEQGK